MISLRQFNTAECITFPMMQIFFILESQQKSLNKLLKRDMKLLNNWLSANQISINTEKTELMNFTFPRKVLTVEKKN